jgi:hypothetical protein
MITCAVRRYDFLLRTIPLDDRRPYLAKVNSATRYTVVRILGVSPEVQTNGQNSRAQRQLSLPAEFGGLNVPSLAPDVEHAHYASFDATPASLSTDYKSESLAHLYGIIRYELHNVATSTLPWAVQLRASHAPISCTDMFAGWVTCRLSGCAGHAHDLLTSPDPRCSYKKGHLQRGISRTLKTRAFIDIIAFYCPPSHDYMRVMLATDRGALAVFMLRMSLT